MNLYGSNHKFIILIRIVVIIYFIISYAIHFILLKNFFELV